MNTAFLIAPGITLVWSGLVIGRILAALTGKKSAVTSTRLSARLVGQPHFHWIAFVEYVLSSSIILAGVLFDQPGGWIILVPLFLFLLQRGLLVPRLSVALIQSFGAIKPRDQFFGSVYIVTDFGF